MSPAVVELPSLGAGGWRVRMEPQRDGAFLLRLVVYSFGEYTQPDCERIAAGHPLHEPLTVGPERAMRLWGIGRLRVLADEWGKVGAPVDPGEPPADGAVAMAAMYAATTALGPDEIAAILDRHAVGMRTYGVPLTVDTPIDAREYAREEALDLVVYGTLMVLRGDARGEWVRYHGVDALLRLR